MWQCYSPGVADYFGSTKPIHVTTGGQEALFCFWQDVDMSSLEGNTNQIPNLSSSLLRCRHIRSVLICMMVTHGLPSRPDWSWGAHSE